MRSILAVAALAVLSAGASSSAAVAQEPDALQGHIEVLRDRFDRAYRDCGLEPPFRAEALAETTPGLVTYTFEDRTLRASRWSELPPPIQGLMTAWAEAGGRGPDGEAHFADIFNSLLIPHEMGHWTQHVSRRAMTLDRWTSEVEANQTAIAFWRLRPEDAEALPARIEAFTGFLGQIPSPVPEGEEPRAWFNAHYETLDPMQYGWFQGAFMREAWGRRDEQDFCDLARLNAPAPPEAWRDD